VIPIHASHLETSAEDVEKKLGNLDGVLVAPGFGERGVQGKLAAIHYVRENKIPFFGICLGMQCAAVEFANNVLSLKNAASKEVDESTSYPVIDLMENQKNISQMGGTMRLGAYECHLKKKSLAYKAYGKSTSQNIPGLSEYSFTLS